MLKNRILLAIFALVFCNALKAQTVVIDDAKFALPAGYSYSSGGSVAVPISLNGCFSPTNTFTWTLLNDATGLPMATPNAASGTVSYFYATFINTVLPATLPTGTYRIAIASSTTGATGDTTQAFQVFKGASVVNAKAQPVNPLLILKDQYYFGICDGNAQTSMVLRDSSTSGGADTLTLIDDYRLTHPVVKVPRDASGKFNLAFNPQYISGKSRDAYYTGFVKTVSGLSVSTIGYQIINNSWDVKSYVQSKNGFTCTGDTVTLGFEIDRTQTSHLQQNYPGALIVVTWNDGSPETHTQCELLALNGKLIHKYILGSCSNAQNANNPSYTITSTVNNPFYVFNGSGLTGTCGAGAYSVASAFVFSPPKAKFSFPIDSVVCVLDTLKFINNSDPGQGVAASGGITGCSQLANYIWVIDHNVNAPLYQTPVGTVEGKKDTAFAFPTFGYHDVTLFVNNNYGNYSPCPSHDTTKRVCVDTAKVRPDFQMDSSGLGVIRDSILGCSPEFHIINNTKSTFCVDSTKFKYKWRVLNAVTGAVIPNNNSFYSYTHGTKDTSRAPWISISQSGKFLIELNASASCAVDTNLRMLKYVEANGSAGVNFTAGTDTVSNCGFPTALTIDYNPAAPINSALSPTGYDSVHYSFQASSAGNLTFKWTVQKETFPNSYVYNPAVYNTDYSYQGGTDSTSKYPKIKFITAGLYKVTIFFNNSCQPKTAVQYVALRQPISVSAGTNTGLTDSVCHTANFFGITGASVSGGGAVGLITWTMDGSGDSYFTPASGDPSTPNIFNPILTLGANDKALACDTGYKFTITMSAFGVRPTACASFSSTRKLYIRPCVSINDTGYNTCSGTALNYHITNPGLVYANMTWTATPVGGTFTTPPPANGSGNAITDVIFGNGIIDYAISPTKDGCPGNVFHFYDTVRPVAGAPVLTVWRPSNAAHSMCSGDRDSITLVGDTPSDVFNWTSFSNQGIITGNKNGTNKPGLIADTLINTSPAGTTDTMNYCVKTVSAYGCPGPQTCATVIVTPGPNIAKITNQPASHTTVFLCDSSCFTIKHSSPGASGFGTLTVTNVTGGPVPFPTIDNDSLTVLCGLKPNTRYKIKWRIEPKLLGCFSSTDSMDVFVVDSLPNISLGNDIVLCDVDGVTPRSVTLTATPSGSTTTSYAYYFSDAPFTAQASANHNFTFTNRGTYKVWANVRNNVCPDRTDTLLIYAFGKPLGAAVTIAPAQSSYCQGSSLSLTANIDTSISAISHWEYTLSGPPGTTTILPTTVNPLVQTATQSANYKALLISKGWSYGCKDSIYTAAPLVIVDSATIAGTITASDTVVCTPNTVVSLTLSGYRGNPSNIRWIQSTTSGTSNYGAPFALGNPISVSVSTTTWYRAIVQNGNCTIDTTLPLKIQLPGAADIAHTGNDTILCGATNILLTGNNPVIGSGSWQMVSGQLNTGGGTGFSFGLPPNDVTTTNPVNANITLPGIYKFVWSIKNLSCPGSSDAITVINRAPIQTNTITASADTVCSGTTVNFTGSVPTNGSGVFTCQWQYSTDNGVTWVPDGANCSNYAYTTSTDVWVRRFVKSDSCYDYSPISKIVVQSKIVNNTVTPAAASACINTPIPTFNGSVPTGASGTYTYAWDTVSAFNNHYSNGLWVNANNITPNYTPGGNLTDIFYVRRIVTSGKCIDTSAVAFVLVNPDAKADFSSPQYVKCAPFTIPVTPFNAISNINYTWYADTAGVRFTLGVGAAFPGYTMLKGLDSVKITLVATSSQGCKSDSLSRWYYTSATPFPSFTVSADSGCANNTGTSTTSFNFTNTTPNVGLFTYQWQSYAGGQTANSTDFNSITYPPSVTGLDAIYTVILTAFSPACGSNTSTHNITIRTRPHVLFSVSPTYQCSGIPDTFTNKTVANANVQYAWIFGDAGNTVGSTQTNPQHTYTVSTLTTICPKLIASNECASDSFTNCVVVAANTVTLNMLVKATDKYKCTPDTVMVYNNSVGGTTYLFDFGDGTPSVPTSNGVDSVTHVYTKPGHYVITLTGSTACGSVTTTDSVIAYGTPIVAFSINPNTTVCKGDSIHFNNLTDTATSYVWNFGNATTSGAVNPVVPYSASGTYSVQLTATRTQPTPIGGSVSCTAVSGVQTVIVKDTMPAAFTITQVGKSCLPDTLLFTNTSAITTLPINTINWNFGDGVGTSVVSPATYVYSNLGQYAVTLNVTNAGGCFYTATQFVNVTAPVGTWLHDTGYICGSASNPAVAHFNLNANATDSITINYGDATPIVTVLYSTFVNPFTHTYTVGGTYYPNVTLKSVNGCTYFVSAFGPIRVDYVKASYTVNPQAQSCGNTVLSFTNTSHNDQLASPPAYTWIVNGFTYNTVNPSVTFNTTGTYNVFLKDSSVSGCVDTVATTPIYVKVNNIPQFLTNNEITRQDTVCAGLVVNYTANPNVSGDPITNYNWSFGNGTTGSGISTQTIYGTQGIFYDTVTIVTSAGCTNTFISKPLVVNGAPVVSINPSTDTAMCLGNSINLTASSSGVIPIATYDWIPVNGGLNVTTGANVIATPTVSTKFIVTGTSANGCTDTASINISIIQPYTITINASPNDSICLGESVVLTAGGAGSYLWSPASGLDTIRGNRVIATPTATTTYTVVGTNASNCFPNTSASILIAVGDTLRVGLGLDTVVLQGGTLYPLNPTIVNGPVGIWNWTTSTGTQSGLDCYNCGNPIATVGANTCYHVDATSIYGCKASSDICIIAFCEASQVYFPNAFTPDGNGVNDYFYMTAVGIQKVLSLRVYNRWGQVVFERSGFVPDPLGTLTPNTLTSWNGKVGGEVAPTEVYVYTCEVQCANGTKFTYTGNVALIK